MFEVFLRCALDRISSGVLVQMNGWLRSFQPSMNAPMAGREVLDGGEGAGADRLPVMTGDENINVSQDPEVGVKCMVIRGLRASQARTCRCLMSRRRESHRRRSQSVSVAELGLAPS